MRNIGFFLFILVLLTLSRQKTFCETYVGGDIIADETWTTSNSPYVVTSTINIWNNATLTVEPGVMVKFYSNTGIIVGQAGAGRLIANGSESDSIAFTSYSGNNADWCGMIFDQASDDIGQSELSHCTIEKAGQNWGGRNATLQILYYNTQLTLCNSRITGDSIEQMAYIEGSTPNIRRCKFFGINTSYLIYDNYSGGLPTIDSCEFVGNISNGLQVDCHSIMRGNVFQFDSIIPITLINTWPIISDLTWHKQSGAYFNIISPIIFYGIPSTKLTIEPGVVIKLANGTYIDVNENACLIAKGSLNDSIVFTSANGQSGGWGGMKFTGNNLKSILKYCIIENAEESGYVLNCNNSDSNLVIQYSRISGKIAGSDIFYMSSVSKPRFFKNKLTAESNRFWINCGSSDGCAPQIDSCVFEGNTECGVQVGSHFEMRGNIFISDSLVPIEVWGQYLFEDRTWSNQIGSYYKILGPLDVGFGSGITLSIEPGVIIKFQSGSFLSIGTWNPGKLLALGTEEDSIIFTAASGSPGGWGGIVFGELSGNVGKCQIDYCRIEKAGGYNGYAGANIVSWFNDTNLAILNSCITNGSECGLFFDNAKPIISNSIIANNASHGIYTLTNSSPELSRCAIINNGGYGLYIDVANTPLIGGKPDDSCELYGNNIYDIYNQNPFSINARYNNWGTNDTNIINARVYDHYDYSENGIVYYKAYTYPEPASVTPQNGTYTRDTLCVFAWQPLPDTGETLYYVLEIGCGPEPFWPVIVDTTADTTVMLSLTQDRHYWRLKGFSYIGDSPYSELRRLVVDITPPLIDSVSVWRDTADYYGPFPINAKIVECYGLAENNLLYRTSQDTTNWLDEEFMVIASNHYLAAIPIQSVADSLKIEYYAYVRDSAGNVATNPITGYHTFWISRITGVSGEPRPAQIVFSCKPKTNPFSEIIAFDVSIPGIGSLDIRIYDILGRIVDKPWSGKIGAGYHQITGRSGISSGLYLYRANSTWGSNTGRVIVIK